MEYTIKSTKISEDGQTFWSSVVYLLTDGTKLEKEVPVFVPTDMDCVLASIENRGHTEQRKYDATQNNMTIKLEMDARFKLGVEIDK